MVTETFTTFFVIYRVHNSPPPNGFNPINILLRHIFQIIFNNIPRITPLSRRQFRRLSHENRVFFLFILGLIWLSNI
jgi:hypothetical protein